METIYIGIRGIAKIKWKIKSLAKYTVDQVLGYPPQGIAKESYTIHLILQKQGS